MKMRRLKGCVYDKKMFVSNKLELLGKSFIGLFHFLRCVTQREKLQEKVFFFCFSHIFLNY